MNVDTPQALMLFLEEHGLAPKRSLSQNFLLDRNILKKIIRLAKIDEGSDVLEIGPGPGALTYHLLQSQANVTVVEKDHGFAKALERFACPRLRIFCDDILDFNLDQALTQKTKVIANLPYNITTPILNLLMPRHDLFSELIIMVQDEVAKRWIARPGSRDYGSSTVFLNFYGKVEYGFFVSPNCFFPKPKVGSAIVKLSLKEPPQVDVEGFFQLTRRAFQQKRKMLRASLKELYSSEAVLKALDTMGKAETTRPEELSLEEFLELFHALKK